MRLLIFTALAALSIACTNTMASDSAGAAADPPSFRVHGEVFNATTGKPQPDVTIELLTQRFGKGDKVVTLTTNQEGVFDSDRKVDLAKGLFPMATYKDSRKFMMIPIPNVEGDCLHCHGKSTHPIRVD